MNIRDAIRRETWEFSGGWKDADKENRDERREEGKNCNGERLKERKALVAVTMARKSSDVSSRTWFSPPSSEAPPLQIPSNHRSRQETRVAKQRLHNGMPNYSVKSQNTYEEGYFKETAEFVELHLWGGEPLPSSIPFSPVASTMKDLARVGLVLRFYSCKGN